MSKIVATEKDIVLIGNGPSAIKYELGTVIDSFFNIGRFNSFYIDGFEKFVGTRTTDWVTVDHFPDVKNRESFRQIYYMIIPSWRITEKFNNFRNVYIDNDIVFKKIVQFPEIPFWDIRKAFKYKNASSGLVTILLSSFLYERVFISGFDFFLSKKHHYGDDISYCFHNGDFEKQIFEKIKNKKENVYYLNECV